MPLPEAKEALAAGLRRGAQQLLPQAIEAAGADWIDRHRHRPDDPGHRPVVRNGHRPARALTTGGGPVGAPPPRVHDWRAADEREKFRAALGPPYLRTTQSGEELVPWLYRQGVSTGDFSEAWAARRGPQAKGLSASTVTRLKGIGEQAYQDGSTRSLAGQHGVYVWADGVSFTIRREAGRPCILVLRRAPADGQKELIAIRDGQRESEPSWKERLLNAPARGWTIDPKWAIGDGALGFGKAVRHVGPAVREQRCWVHQTANVLGQLPQGVPPKAKEWPHDIYLAPGRAEAEKTFDLFVRPYEAKYPKAPACPVKDRNALRPFSDFPAEHGLPRRPANVIERVFATVRLRTEKTKGSGPRQACLAMVFKRLESASRRGRALNGSPLLAAVLRGGVFVDGVKQEDAA